MEKILTFIVNENNELLLLKGSKKDPQFKKSFWYVVTGGCEEIDLSREESVRREVKEETGLVVNDMLYLNWIFEYKSLGKVCTEYAYISFVNKSKVVLNEESVEYKWCELDEFIEKIQWFWDKEILEKVLCLGMERNIYFEEEKVDKC